ncbi:hypothetical protein AXG93_810s1050 [Marchantia polymorpha subsp. ruderalis]|uniref:Uncharacterized protein n=1 Tax=Marchantia polymorpha subsp. ruderalis TaxID=1480154 RepID=A0A176W9R0_MARPO|nr:hypothetical protein AXG93_810s1050 [Marchantia polymorpha subsp. ruderalis]
MEEDVEPTKERTATVGGTVVDFPEISSPPPLEEEIRTKVEKKASQEESQELVVSFLDFLQDSVVPLLKYLDEKREKYVVPKKANLEKRDHYNAAELAVKEKECRAEKERSAEEVVIDDYVAVEGVADKSRKDRGDVSTVERRDN